MVRRGSKVRTRLNDSIPRYDGAVCRAPTEPSLHNLQSQPLSPVPSRRPTPRSRVHTPSFSNCPPCLSPDPSAPERNENSENSKCNGRGPR